MSSIINLKGGVGKSTLTMILAEYLAFRFSKRVLVIDMDAQANLSYCMVAPDSVGSQFNKGRTVYHLFKAALEGKKVDIRQFITRPPLVVSNIARASVGGATDIIEAVVSHPSVAELDQDLLDLWRNKEPMPTALEGVFSEALAPVLDDYAYILIDCPPGLSFFSSMPLMASDYFISPVIPEPLSMQGVDLVVKRTRHLNQLGLARIEFAGVVLNIVKHYRGTHKATVERLYGDTNRMETYKPFSYWLPDNERLRRLGEFEIDSEYFKDGVQWAGGVPVKFGSVYHKYAVPYRLANPASGSLKTTREGSEYKLEERIAHLVEEFQQRVNPGSP